MFMHFGWLQQIDIEIAHENGIIQVISVKCKQEVLQQVNSGRFVAVRKHRCDVSVWQEARRIRREELLERVRDVHGLFCDPSQKIDAELLEHAPNLKVVGTSSVGHDHVDLPAVRARGVKVGYTPDVLTNTVAELALALTLATTRNFFHAEKAVRAGEWGAWDPTWMLGDGIDGSTVGIFGMGRIGVALVEKIAVFKPEKILYCNRNRSKAEKELGVQYVAFEELLLHSDILICTAACTPETMEIFNMEAFLKMKKNAYFINVSRGGLVNQDDLFEALQNGVIRAAGLDVCTPEPLPADHKLLSLPNLSIIPHLGSATWQTRAKMAELTARNILAGLEDQPLPAELE